MIETEDEAIGHASFSLSSHLLLDRGKESRTEGAKGSEFCFALA